MKTTLAFFEDDQSGTPRWLTPDQLQQLAHDLDILVTSENWADVRQNAMILIWNQAHLSARKYSRIAEDWPDLTSEATVRTIHALDYKFNPDVPHTGTEYVESLTGYIRSVVPKLVRQLTLIPFHADTQSAVAELDKRIAHLNQTLHLDIRPGDQIVADLGKTIMDEWHAKGKYPIAEFWKLWHQASALPFDPTSEKRDSLRYIVEETVGATDHSDSPNTTGHMAAALVDDLDGLVAAYRFQSSRRRPAGPFKQADHAINNDPRHADDQHITARLKKIKPLLLWSAGIATWAEQNDRPVAIPQAGILTDAVADILTYHFSNRRAIDRSLADWNRGDDCALFMPFGSITTDQKDTVADFLRTLLDQSGPAKAVAAVTAWINAAARHEADVTSVIITGNANTLITIARTRLDNDRAA